jgi:methylamine dehydrogenase heavy chain
VQSAKRSEIYAIETFHPRGTRGERQDFLTIWDQENLSPVAEVPLPGGKRFMGMPQRYATLLMNDDKWLAVANFSPATSVTLVDLEAREIVREIPTPGCVFTYPTGKLGFSSLCADGRFMSTELNAAGEVLAQTRTDSFFSSDDSPIYERPAVIGDTAYFPTIAGLVFPVDMSDTVARVGEPWHLVPESERGEKWAPGGIGLIDRDDNGRFYIIMHPGAVDGSYQGGGPEVWVYDAAAGKRVKRIKLKEWGLSLAVSRGSKPSLMVVNPGDMSLEMYDPESGEFLRKISDFGQQTPLMVHGSR